VPQQVIPILRVADAARSIEWYGQLGFSVEWIHRFDEHLPAFVSLSRGHGRIYLSEHEGDASADTLLYVRHGDLDRVARALGVEITDNPWGRDIEVRDPDGNRLRIGEPVDD
jgi:catechol 2,3-dioxygenase-like lactoylglutathione lyase family enzyme